MIRRAVPASLLLGLTGCSATTPPPRLTLAEAQRLSPQALGVRLLGATGASGNYVEAKVHGNGGGMIAAPGLNGVDLYTMPKSAGFAGLCQVDAVSIMFEHGRAGDTPHAVHDFYKFSRFALIEGASEPVDDAGWKKLHNDCARLHPVADRPGFFAVIQGSGNAPAEAHFAMRALRKARLAAPGMATAIRCTPDRSDKEDRTCVDPAATVAAYPIGRIKWVRVYRCPDRLDRYCVRASYAVRAAPTRGQDVELEIATDAPTFDPPQDFSVTAIAVSAGTWVE